MKKIRQIDSIYLLKIIKTRLKTQIKVHIQIINMIFQKMINIRKFKHNKFLILWKIAQNKDNNCLNEQHL